MCMDQNAMLDGAWPFSENHEVSSNVSTVAKSDIAVLRSPPNLFSHVRTQLASEYFHHGLVVVLDFLHAFRDQSFEVAMNHDSFFHFCGASHHVHDKNLEKENKTLSICELGWVAVLLTRIGGGSCFGERFRFLREADFGRNRRGRRRFS